MAVTATSAVVNRSWAAIVKGDSGAEDSQPQEKQALQPSARGERRCLCQGEILVMLGHYGWIMSFDEIDHSDAGKTGGRIYLHKRDVLDGASLQQGDRVSFYLYADDQGLGAEACELQQSATSGLDAEAFEFTPAQATSCLNTKTYAYKQVLEKPPMQSWNAGAHEFVPAAVTTQNGFNSQAAEFVPSVFSPMNADVKEFVPTSHASNLTAQNMFAINLAFFSDDESDEESSTVSMDDFAGVDGDRESDNSSDSESVHSESPKPQVQDSTFCTSLGTVLSKAPWKLQGEESDGSTSAGSTSGSEDFDARPWRNLATRLAKTGAPGMTLPAGFRLPPGLSLPGIEA